MKAEIKDISCDYFDLSTYTPIDPESFSFPLFVTVGTEFAEGEDLFYIQVCTPKWILENHCREDVIIGRHYLIVMEYDYARIIQTITAFCSQWEASTWPELAEKLGRLGQWEFEDHQEQRPGEPWSA